MAGTCSSSIRQYYRITINNSITGSNNKSNMAKRHNFATILGHVQPIGRPCGTWMHYARKDVMDMGQQNGYRSLENWSKEAMNRLFRTGLLLEPRCFNF